MGEDKPLITGDPGKTVVPPADGKQTLREEVIKHISSEIIAEATYLASIRTRVGFTVLTGPFIIVGSVLVAFKGPFEFSGWNKPMIFWCVAAFVSYMGAAGYFAMLDHHSTQQCNSWREAILKLSQGEELKKKELKAGIFRKRKEVSGLHFEHYAQFAYPLGFLIICCAFASIIGIILQLRPVQPAVETQTPNVHRECCQDSSGRSAHTLPSQP